MLPGSPRMDTIWALEPTCLLEASLDTFDSIVNGRVSHKVTKA